MKHLTSNHLLTFAETLSWGSVLMFLGADVPGCCFEQEVINSISYIIIDLLKIFRVKTYWERFCEAAIFGK